MEGDFGGVDPEGGSRRGWGGGVGWTCQFGSEEPNWHLFLPPADRKSDLLSCLLFVYNEIKVPFVRKMKSKLAIFGSKNGDFLLKKKEINGLRYM